MFQEITLHDYRASLHKRRQDRLFCGPYRWRPAKPGSGTGFYSASGDMLRMDRHGSRLDLRLSLANDMLVSYSRLRNTLAYWADDDGSTTLTPIVARLPHGKGFLAGWSMGAGMCGTLDGHIHHDEQEAAWAAHALAEADAEREREYREEHPED